ncbi:unnamed protein product [Euphydryas editha]|uniref:Uncharacterized protein n=1 Tax=Euphydryas editha TaxID=104508 RepID=A0AAU9UI17_EUPED|nr:unnamed protein product [Euphydryas editha]
MYKFLILMMAVIVVSAQMRRPPDPTPSTESTTFLEVSSEKCDILKNDFCGSVAEPSGPSYPAVVGVGK